MSRRRPRSVRGGFARLVYLLEKGHPHAQGFWLLAQVLGLTIVIGGLAFHAAGVEGGLGEAMWRAFLHLSDPGSLEHDRSAPVRAVGTILTTLGMILVTAFFIAVTTSLVATALSNVRNGGFNVVFDDHVVIVGWDDKVFTLVQELLLADPSMEIAILGSASKEAAERELKARLFTPRPDVPWWQRRRTRSLRRQVVYRCGDPRVDAHLGKVGAGAARKFVLLATGTSTGLDSDVATLRTYMAIRRYRRDHASDRRFDVVMEVTDERYRSHAFVAAGLDPRADAWVDHDVMCGRAPDVPCVGEEPSGPSEQLTLVNVDEIVSRVLVQCAVQPRLSLVFEELLSFAGNEFLVVDPADARRSDEARWAELIRRVASSEPAHAPGIIARSLASGLVVGIHKDLGAGRGRVHFDPDTLAADFGGSPLVVLGQSQDHRDSVTGSFRMRFRDPLDVPLAGRLERPSSHKRCCRVLVLGHNRRAPTLVQQFTRYTSQYSDLDLHLTLVGPGLDEAAVRAEVMRHQVVPIRHMVAIDADFTDWSVLVDVLSHGAQEAGGVRADTARPFDSIVLLSEDRTDGSGDLDARVTLGLVMLRALRADPRYEPHLRGTSVVAEVVDPRTAEVIERPEWLSDVIISNQYVSRFIAQVALEPELEDVYRELLDYQNREIYIRPVQSYVTTAPDVTPFVHALDVAAYRGEVALGYVVNSRSADARVVLAPPVEDPMVGADSVIVVAES